MFFLFLSMLVAIWPFAFNYIKQSIRLTDLLCTIHLTVTGCVERPAEVHPVRTHTHRKHSMAISFGRDPDVADRYIITVSNSHAAPNWVTQTSSKIGGRLSRGRQAKPLRTTA